MSGRGRSKGPWLPVADLFSGFVLVLLLMLVISMVVGQLGQAQVERALMEQLRDSLAEFAQQGALDVRINERLIRFRDVSFETGSACLSVVAKRALASLAPTLRDAFAKFPELVVYVEGHTDPRRIAGVSNRCGYFADNVQLSSLRAANARQYLLVRAGLPEQYADRIAVAAYGASRPLNKNDPYAAENRRVDLRLSWAQRVEKESGNTSDH